jgi:hypothetical protein
LIQKIARQVQYWVRYAPATGPTAVNSPGDDEEDREALAPLLRGKGVQHEDRGGGDQEASRCSLDRPEGDQPGLCDPGVRNEPAHQRAGREQDHADDHDLAVAGDVPEAATEGDECRRGERVGRDQPLHTRLGEVDVPLDRRRGDADDGEVDEHHRHRRDERPQDAVARKVLH